MKFKVSLRALSLASVAFLFMGHTSHAEPRAGITCDPCIYSATNDGKTENTVMLQ